MAVLLQPFLVKSSHISEGVGVPYHLVLYKYNNDILGVLDQVDLYKHNTTSSRVLHHFYFYKYNSHALGVLCTSPVFIQQIQYQHSGVLHHLVLFVGDLRLCFHRGSINHFHPRPGNACNV